MSGSKFPADKHNYIIMMSYLHTKFHDNWISSFRGVAMTRFWDGRTDGETRLLDLLSPLATQVKTCHASTMEIKKCACVPCINREIHKIHQT